MDYHLPKFCELCGYVNRNQYPHIHLLRKTLAPYDQSHHRSNLNGTVRYTRSIVRIVPVSTDRPRWYKLFTTSNPGPSLKLVIYLFPFSSDTSNNALQNVSRTPTFIFRWVDQTGSIRRSKELRRTHECSHGTCKEIS